MACHDTFPRNDLRNVRVDEMKIMYAMLNKTRISPIIGMIDYWLGTFQRDEYVECTTIITRLARNMGLLDRALINYYPLIESILIMITFSKHTC